MLLLRLRVSSGKLKAGLVAFQPGEKVGDGPTFQGCDTTLIFFGGFAAPIPAVARQLQDHLEWIGR